MYRKVHISGCGLQKAAGSGQRLNDDVQGAFRTVPVHPHGRWLLGMCWEGKTYIDTVLPFGLRSAPAIYNAVAEALMWVLRRHDGVDGIHYLDNFRVFGRPRVPKPCKSLWPDVLS